MRTMKRASAAIAAALMLMLALPETALAADAVPYAYGDGTATTSFAELVTADMAANAHAAVLPGGAAADSDSPAVYGNSYGTIDVTDADGSGYVTLALAGSGAAKMAGVVDYEGPDGSAARFAWSMSDGEEYRIPLYMGSGKYALSIMEHTGGTRYAARLRIGLDVELESELAPFLASTKDADFEHAPMAAAKARELTEGCATVQDRINVIYNWVFDSIEYDLDTVTSPSAMDVSYDLDLILERRSGVCGDRASLMAGMLRSIGIPCKVTYGKGESGAHAWIVVWNETERHVGEDGAAWSAGGWVELDSTSKAVGVEGYEILYYR